MNFERITDFFFEIASLRRLTRSHKQFIRTANDNISDHCFRVAVIGMNLAKMENADENKVLKMCLFHDIEEARTGDFNSINKLYAERHSHRAFIDQMKGLPIEEEMIALADEYKERITKESVVAKDADILDQIVLEQEYFLNDNANRKIWQDHMHAQLKTETAKKLSKQIRKTNPFDWLYKIAKAGNYSNPQ